MQAKSDTIGFVGVGHMGGAIADRLIGQGSRLLVFDTSAAAVNRMLEAGAEAAASAREIADRVEVVFTCLPSRQACIAVARELAAGRAVRLHVEMSTIGRPTLQTIAGILSEKGISIVDCPVSGGPYGARAGTLGAMIAGAEADVRRIEPILKQFASKLVHVGAVPGFAQIAKIVNNAISMTAFVISCEAMVVGASAGVAPQALLDAVNAGTGRNSATVDKIPLGIVNRKFNLGAPLGSAIKDLELYLEEARLQHIPPFLVSNLTEFWRHAVSQLGEDVDFSRLIQCYEQWAGVEFAEPQTTKSSART